MNPGSHEAQTAAGSRSAVGGEEGWAETLVAPEGEAQADRRGLQDDAERLPDAGADLGDFYEYSYPAGRSDQDVPLG